LRQYRRRHPAGIERAIALALAVLRLPRRLPIMQHVVCSVRDRSFLTRHLLGEIALSLSSLLFLIGGLEMGGEATSAGSRTTLWPTARRSASRPFVLTRFSPSVSTEGVRQSGNKERFRQSLQFADYGADIPHHGVAFAPRPLQISRRSKAWPAAGREKVGTVG
jgi:hypothetical protein